MSREAYRFKKIKMELICEDCGERFEHFGKGVGKAKLYCDRCLDKKRSERVKLINKTKKENEMKKIILIASLLITSPAFAMDDADREYLIQREMQHVEELRQIASSAYICGVNDYRAMEEDSKLEDELESECQYISELYKVERLK